MRWADVTCPLRTFIWSSHWGGNGDSDSRPPDLQVRDAGCLYVTAQIARLEVDLRRALDVVSSPLWLPGESDPSVADSIKPSLHFSTAEPIPMLHGGQTVRCVDVLHELAVATRFMYEPTVLDAYSQWALLRYLGAFDIEVSPKPRVSLSDAGRRVIANQRRVMSEDLGIGVSVALARRWLAADSRADGLQVVDVDVAVEAGVVDRRPGKRADYLLLSTGPANGGLVVNAFLESKGSASRQYQQAQLLKAAQQLENTTIYGRRVIGLACATNAGRERFEYSAVSVMPREAGSPPEISSVSALSGLLSTPPTGGAAVFGASLARLAEIANEPVAFNRWAPAGLRERRRNSTQFRRGDSQRFALGSRTFVGTSTTLALPGGRLRARLGVDEAVVEALVAGDLPAFLTAQRSVRVESELPMQAAKPSLDYAASMSGDGTALVLEAD